MSTTLEKTEIERALQNNDGNVGAAARELGAARRTLQNRMRAYGIPRGKSGRRKRPLPYRRVSKSAGALLGAAALLGVGVLFVRGHETA